MFTEHLLSVYVLLKHLNNPEHMQVQELQDFNVNFKKNPSEWLLWLTVLTYGHNN